MQSNRCSEGRQVEPSPNGADPENQNTNGAAQSALVPGVEISRERIVLWN
jgi:hypothetical protein